MGNKYLGIDFGLKRVGVAVSDEGKTISFPRITILNNNSLFDNLLLICREEYISKIIIGLPLRLNSENTHITEAAKIFSSELKIFLNQRNFFPDFFFIDERFTSSLAQSYISESVKSKKKRKDKSLTDSISAQIILQDFLDREKNLSK
jgi:putative Holliday junction resolvase